MNNAVVIDKEINQIQKRPSQAADIWRRFKRNKPAVFGLILLSILVFFAVFADFFADYNTVVISTNPDAMLLSPSMAHIFGTDTLGRDIFARLIHGGRVSLSIAISSTFLILVIGGLIGASVAYFGGYFDIVVMRIADAFMCVPGTLLTLTLIVAFGTGSKALIIAMVISGIPSCAIVMRSLVLGIAKQDYIEAARASGVKTFRIITQHILPNALGPIIVNTAMSISGQIMAISGLSFIGAGIQPPTPEWGSMISESMQYLRLYPHLIIFPSIVLSMAILAFNLLGDGITDAFDPKLKD